MDRNTYTEVVNSITNNDLEKFKDIIKREDMIKELNTGESILRMKMLTFAPGDFLYACLPHLNNSSIQLLLEKHTRLNNKEVVEKLLSYGKPSKTSNCLIAACINKDVDMVKLLIPVSNVKYKNSKALLVAISHESDEIVKALLPHSNVKYGCSYPMQRAIFLNNKKVIDLLWDKSNIEHVINALNSKGSGLKDYIGPGLIYFYQKYDAQKSKNILTENIKNKSPHPRQVRKKIL